MLHASFVLGLWGLLAAAGAHASPEPARHYVVEESALAASKLAFPAVARENGRALLKLTPGEFARIKRYLHENSFGCGGIVDLTPYLGNDASKVDSAQAIARFSASAKADPPPAVNLWDKPLPTFPTQTRQLLAFVRPDRYRGYLTRLATFTRRSARTQEGVDAAQWFATTAQALASQYGKTIETISIPTGGRYRQPSTIIKVAGTRPELSAIVIGGHMDTTAGLFNPRGNNPGADDDASGSATVLEVLSALLESPLRLQRTAYFMFYAAEEDGLVGSGVIATKFKRDRTAVRGVVQFDMTAYHPADNAKIYFMQDYVDVGLSAFLEKLAIEYVGLRPDQIARDNCGYGCSDHASWNENGYSAASPFETSMRGHNPKIHTRDDALGLVDWAHTEKFVRLGAAFVAEAGDPL